jgi:hypothetical protein
MNGGSNLQTTTQQAPSWQLPFQSYGLNQAQSQYQNTPQLVAPFAPQQNQAITNIGQMAQNGNPAVNAAQNYATQTLNGNVFQNPELNNLFQQGADQIQKQMASEFANAGRNVDASQGQTAQALGNFGANLYGNAFNTETQAQMGALGAAPGIQNSQLGMQNALYGAGQNVQNLSQQYIQAPQNALNQYLARVNGNLGATQQFQPAFNAGAGALGGALTGVNLGNSIGSAFGGSSGGGWGSLLGGLLGGVAGG